MDCFLNLMVFPMNFLSFWQVLSSDCYWALAAENKKDQHWWKNSAIAYHVWFSRIFLYDMCGLGHDIITHIYNTILYYC